MYIIGFIVYNFQAFANISGNIKFIKRVFLAAA